MTRGGIKLNFLEKIELATIIKDGTKVRYFSSIEDLKIMSQGKKT